MTLFKNFILIVSIIILYLSTTATTTLWHGIALIFTGILTVYLERDRFYTNSDYPKKLKKIIQLSGRLFGGLMIIIGVIILL